MILILHLTGYFLSGKKYRYMLCNRTLNEVILSPFSTKNLHVKNRNQIFVKFLGQWWVKWIKFSNGFEKNLPLSCNYCFFSFFTIFVCMRMSFFSPIVPPHLVCTQICVFYFSRDTFSSQKVKKKYQNKIPSQNWSPTYHVIIAFFLRNAGVPFSLFLRFCLYEYVISLSYCSASFNVYTDMCLLL